MGWSAAFTQLGYKRRTEEGSHGIIWPPHKPIDTSGAVFLALILTGLFVYMRFAFALPPLEQFYLPLYVKTSIAPSIRSSGKCQIDIAVAKYSTEIVSFREELGFCRQRKHGAFVGFGTLPCHDFPPARASNKTCLHDDLKTAHTRGELEDRFHHGLDDAVKCEAKPGAPVLNH
jgi:hypothetical protein